MTTQIEVLAAIKEAVHTRGSAAIYITHDLAVVAQVADRIMVLRYGDLIEEGETRDLLSNPTEEYTKRLLAVRSLREERSEQVSDAVVLKVDGITARYPNADQDVLEGVSVEVERGKTVALSGNRVAARALWRG